MTHDTWAVGSAYERYVGRWSREVAAAFVAWLSVPERKRWLDVGCGTGALTATALANAHPLRAVGIDPSFGFVSHAHETVHTREYIRARETVPAREKVQAAFLVGDARSLPFADDAVDVAVSGLVLNFVPDAERAVSEMSRVVSPGGAVAAYVWDYADGMEMMRHFWDAAAEFDPATESLDEGQRFPICRPEPLRELWVNAGLDAVTVKAIEVPTVFRDFDDYWTPFLGGQGPAPGYVMSLAADRRTALRDSVRERLPEESDGSIRLTARAWAVRGVATP